MPRIYRGWWVVSVPFLAAALGTGAGQYGFGIFIEPLEQTFGWSRSQISASLSFTAVGSLLAPMLGRFIDRYGARPVIAGSLALVALSFVMRPMMTELWHWYALSLLQYAGYTGASMLPAGKLVGLWFRRTRGRVMGITAMGNNFGGLVFPPMMGWMLLLMSWQATYVALGIMTVLLLAYTLLMVRDSPSECDLEDGATELEIRGAAPVTGRTVGQALRDKSFYAIAVAVTLGTFTYSAIIPQIIPHLLDGGTTLAVASIVLSLYAIAGMVGKFIMGLVAERVTSRYALMLNFVGQAVFLLAMIRADNPMVMWTAVPVLGIFNGAFGALFQLVVQDAFGIRYFGSIMGLINFATLVSFFFGPILAGVSYDITGSYTLAFLAVSGMFATAALALTQAKPRTDLQ
ncbi:MAG: MFS transporter [Dehalococcoidia bacterium]|nr:MFS transporter [Dehalococcoidia bacterium]